MGAGCPFTKRLARVSSRVSGFIQISVHGFHFFVDCPMRALASSTTCTILTTAVIYVPYSVDCCCAHSSPLCLQPKRCNRKRSPENRLHTTEIVHNRCCTMRVYQQVSTVDCSCVLREACVSPRLICFAVFGLLALCIGRLVPALAAFSVPVDVTHIIKPTSECHLNRHSTSGQTQRHFACCVCFQRNDSSGQCHV